MKTRSGGLLAIAALAFGAVAVALLTQHSFGMAPCPWCVLQRLIFVVIGAVALLGLAFTAVLALRMSLRELALLTLTTCAVRLVLAFLQLRELAAVRNADPHEVVRCENCGRILVRTAESGL